MRTILICVLLAILTCGCASVSINPATGVIQYIRIGDQKVSVIYIEKVGDRVSVKMLGQESEGNASDAVEAAASIVKLIP